MEVHEARQCFKADNGRISFLYTRVIFSRDGKLFSGHSPSESVGTSLHVNDLEDVKHIPEDAYSPATPPHSTIAPKWKLVQTAPFSIQELAVCELIKRHPHPNIATYYGCQSTKGRVTGLCFERYQCNLAEKINPDHLNKTMFISTTDRGATCELANRCLPGVKAGIQHLHSLGLVHNDLNPSNIMIAADGRPIIIDFDSCRPIGADLKRVKRTHEWYNPDTHISLETNDLYALEEIRVWLTGSNPTDYLFGG
ncbi:kinase-like domain-containing protein [Nemania sp. FL0031]|nr:kinase-like domain-containing protein [Nemania sp. FL0031]